eukprot:3943398-Prymnesium_polylepis.2
MAMILDDIPQEHAAAARALQSVLLEMLDEAEDEDDGEEAEECEPCDECEPEAPAASHAPTDAERAAAAYFQEVTEAVGLSTEGLNQEPRPASRTGFENVPNSVVKHSKRLGGGVAAGLSLHYFGEDSHNCLEALVREQKAAENEPQALLSGSSEFSLTRTHVCCASRLFTDMMYVAAS